MIMKGIVKGKKRSLFGSQHVKAGFSHMFGTANFITLALVCCTMIALGWFGDIIWTLCTDETATFSQFKTWFGLLTFPAFVIIWFVLIKKALDETSNLIIKESKDVHGCKALVIYLSQPGKDTKMIEQLLEKRDSLADNGLQDDSFRQRFQGSWRMPLEAIAYHHGLGTLETVLVIPSKNSQRRAQNGMLNTIPGTYMYFENFRRLIQHISIPDIKVFSAGEIDSRWQQGVDYESAKELTDCLKNSFTWLENKEYTLAQEIIVDITSGQKVGSTVASVMSLGLGRQVQYVSTNDYILRAYDITYDSAQ